MHVPNLNFKQIHVLFEDDVVKVLQLFINEGVPKGQIIMLMAVISGLANSALLAVINVAAEQVSNQAMIINGGLRSSGWYYTC